MTLDKKGPVILDQEFNIVHRAQKILKEQYGFHYDHPIELLEALCEYVERSQRQAKDADRKPLRQRKPVRR
jgi:hypothetical protein